MLVLGLKNLSDYSLFFKNVYDVIGVSFFKNSLLAEKQKELGDAASKLLNGLEKIDDTRKKVRCYLS